MVIPSKDFKGIVLLSFGKCSNISRFNKKTDKDYTQEDLDELDVFDYFDANNIDIDENNNKIEVKHSLTGEIVEVEKVECEISGGNLYIENEVYIYIKEDDIYMSLEMDTYDKIVRVHAIYDKCEECGDDEYIIPLIKHIKMCFTTLI